MSYLYLQAFHIIAVVTWFAMLFYLPRLYVYHAENYEKKEFVEVIKVMERKLYLYIGVPSLWAVILSGTGLIMMNPSIFQNGWIHAKITLIIVLVGYHLSTNMYRKQLEQDVCEKSGKFFRVYNEFPTILLILIVFLAVVKPF